MAQTIKIKRSTGSAAPSTLAQGELAYSKGSDTLYVGDPATANTPIPVGGAIKNNAGSPELATGVTAAEIRTLVGVDAAGTDNSTDVTLAGTPDYITISGQTITRNQINLTTDVTGDLPIAEGGTGASTAAAARTNLGVDAAGTDNSTDVTLAGTPDYITISGQTITRNQINLTTDVTGDLPIAEGGTGASTASGARTNLGLGSLATLSAVGSAQITDGSVDTAELAADAVTNAKIATGAVNADSIAANAVGASELNVSGNGTSGQALVSDGDGTFSWSTISVTDNDVNVANLTARLPQITSSVTIGDASDVTVTMAGDLAVTGDLTVNGTTTTVNSTTVTIDDPIFTLGGDTAPASDDNKDRGIEFNWHNGSAAKVGFFGFDDSAGKFTFIPDATNTSEVFSGTAGTIVADLEGDVTGNADTATTLATSRNFSISGDITASAVGFDGSGNVALSANIDAGVVGSTELASNAVTSGKINNGAVTFAKISTGAVTTSAEAFSDSDTQLMTAAAIDDLILSKGYSTTVGDITNVTAGTGLSGGGASGSVTLNVDLSELTDMTAAMVGTDEFIVLDAGADRRKAASEINLSIFNNDSGFTSNVGDITSVQVSSTDGSISGTGTGTTGAVSFDLEVATIDGGTY